MQKVFFVDMDKCTNCKTCEIACKNEYNLPIGIRWRKVQELKSDKPLYLNFLSMSCNHCSDAPCIENCPVGAYSRRGDGIVVQDHDLCIGCQTCVDVCPFGAPQYDPNDKPDNDKKREDGRTSKCEMCYERTTNGLPAKCVDACPMGAIQIGDREEMLAMYPDADRITQEQAPPSLPVSDV